MKYTGKVQKFIIVPICTIYDENQNVVEEHRMKAITHFPRANALDLRELANRMEEAANARLLSQVETPKGL